MTVPHSVTVRHARLILKSLEFKGRYGGDSLVNYLRQVRDNTTRKWMSQEQLVDVLETLSESINKVSGYEYPDGTNKERLRRDALLPLIDAYGELSEYIK